MSDMNKVESLIQSLAEEKALSLEALTKVKELRDSYAATLKAIEDGDTALKKQMELVSHYMNQTSVLRTEVTRLESLVKKEADLEVRDKLLKMSESQAMKERDLAVDLFKTVFANVTLRRSIATPMPAYNLANGNSQYYNQQTTNEETHES